MRNNVSGF